MTVEAAVLSAGFAATITTYMMTQEDYSRFAKFVQISIVFFAVCAIFECSQQSKMMANAFFIIGWFFLISALILASYSAEIIGLNATLYHTIMWAFRYGSLAEALRTQLPIKPLEKKEVIFEFLQGNLHDRIFRGTSIAIIGNVEDFPNYFAHQILFEGLENSENIIYVNTQNIPIHIRDELNLPKQFERKFYLLDVYTPCFGLGEIPITGRKEKFSAKCVKDIHTQIRKIRVQIGLGKDIHRTRIIYDSLEMLGGSLGEESLMKFILHSLPVEVGLGWISVYIIHPDYENTKIFRLIRNSVDCIIRLSTRIEKGRTVKTMRLIKMQNSRFNKNEITYDVNSYEKWRNIHPSSKREYIVLDSAKDGLS